MTPYFERDGVTIYHGDCRDVLPSLGRVALVLTDPPYGLGDRWQGGTWGANPIYADARRWDQATPTADTLAQVVAAGDDAIVWGGHLFGLPPSRGWLAWVKSNSVPTMGDFELAWTTLDRPPKAYHAGVNPDGRREHPTQKPLGLMRWCLTTAGGSGTVLDPFMGSGTTLRAALDLGRRAIGIEIEERYCEIAARRLDQMVLPLATMAVAP